MSEPHVIAVVATYRRPAEISRLFGSLAGVQGIVICDNSSDPAVRDAVAASPIPAHYLSPPGNLGCGGGLRLAEEHAWKIAGADLTHLLVLDDDAVLEPGTVDGLRAVLDREGAAAAYPLVIGPDGDAGWMPGLRDPALHRLGKEAMEPGEYSKKLGVEVAEFDWAQGICLLAAREAVERAGFHRPDFWVRGEDLDFSLRLTRQGRGLFVPRVRVRHLPPPSAAPVHDRREYLRHAAMVQNIAYLAFRQPHGAVIRGSIAGTSRRFLALWGLSSVADLLRALWRGAIGAEAAGTGQGRTFRARFDELR
jgi:rhamnopyranosyl-N-acetylglucosaminyl-diphospho-decaprenol beta-1,3/1,4-galactofuranosyltransferase